MPPPAFTREGFRADARPLPVKVGEIELTAKPIEHRTGSLGFRAAGRAQIVVSGCLVDVQVSAVVTVIGSKTIT